MLFTTHMITAATVLLSLTGTASAGHVRSRSHRHASLAARQASIESRDEYNEVLKRAQQDGRISVAQYARSQVELKESKKKRKSSSAGQKRVLRKKSGGSCKIRPSGDAAAADEGFVASSSSTSASSTSVAATQAAVAKETPAAEDGATSAAWSEPAAATSTTSQWSEPQPTWTPEPSPAPAPAPQSNPGNAVGLLHITESTCGACPSSGDAPNGAQWWLNCGIDNSGWNPPHVSIEQLIASELTADGVFAPCAPYIDTFKAVGAATGVPPVMLASFAMQESTCNKDALGRNGEISLMQLTPANCPAGANCWDPYTNIKVASELFRNMVNHNGGNVLAAIGAYNGWQPGLTVGKANSAPVCTQRNNLDYLHEFLNFWMQGKSGYGKGTYHNTIC